MSGDGFAAPYNRFDLFEKALMGEHCDCPPKCDCEKCTNKDGTKKAKKDAKPDFLDLDKDGDKEEDMEDAVSEGYQRNPEKGEKEDKKYAPVRGEKTPMPPRGDKRREDFEKWYAKNVKEDVDLSIFSDVEVEALMGLYEGYIPRTPEMQKKIDRQIGRVADKEAIESGKRERDRDDKKVDKLYQRQIAMKFGKKMKKEDYGYSEVYENRMAAYTAGESEKGSRGPAKVTGGKTIDIKDLPKLKEPSAEEKAKARKALGLKNEETEQDGPKPTNKQAVGAQKNIRKNLNLAKHDGDKDKLAFEKARAKAWGMKEESEHDKEVAKHRAAAKKKVDMPAGDVGHDIHDRAVKAYNKRNPSKAVREELEATGVFSESEIDTMLESLLGKN